MKSKLANLHEPMAQSIICQIPENLDIETLIRSSRPDFSYKYDGFIYLIDLIMDQMSRIKVDKKSLSKHYVALHSQSMKVILGNYQLYLNYLVYNNIIEKNDSYQEGVSSKGYRLKEQYLTPTIEVKLSYKKLITKIKRFRIRYNEPATTKYPELIKWFNGLQIEYEPAMNWINEWYDSKTMTSNGKRKKTISMKVIHKYNSYKRTILKVKEKDYSFLIDNSGYRLHTVLTNMKKDLRDYLKYNNKSLVCIDLSNSQPYLAQVLFNKAFYSSEKVSYDSKIKLTDLPLSIQRRIKPEINGIINILTTSFKNPLEASTINSQRNYTFKIVSMTHFLHTGLELDERLGYKHAISAVEENGHYRVDIACDWLWYVEVVSNGTFYRYVGEAIKEHYPKSKVNPKKMALTAFFANNSEYHIGLEENKNMFKELFPNVDLLFSSIKNNDHATMALLLQSIESEVFLNRIAQRISSERLDVPIFTIHDSICTTIENEAFVRSVMTKELEASIGKRPKMKSEYLEIKWTTSH
ncbi:hypothetical protein [Fibrivirga algicola]|uniref:DNA-directed RNA polymerase n=1 Tax=Fibrivirga algicola TaxID=2950420 RepID=A0ABX0QCI1_9BACT|nr:hypothetical protein [Fibrivirga algicola]NID08925.1 hypothetical protein [Fibrivirga algicola]